MVPFGTFDRATAAAESFVIPGDTIRWRAAADGIWLSISLSSTRARATAAVSPPLFGGAISIPTAPIRWPDAS